MTSLNNVNWIGAQKRSCAKDLFLKTEQNFYWNKIKQIK